MPPIVIIGAGIVGAWTAVECLDHGREVVMVEPAESGGRQAASYGNGGWIMEASLLPVATPGLWRSLPSMLADPRGALTVRWRHLPELAPWLVRFLAAGMTGERVAAIAAARHNLVQGARNRYAALAREAGLEHSIASAGHLFVYPGQHEHRSEALSWDTRARYGHGFVPLQGEVLRKFEAGLGPGYGYGALMREGQNLPDPGGFVAGVTAYAVRRGATVQRARAIGWRFEGERLRAVVTDRGEIEAAGAIVTGGIGSLALARAAGDRLPLESERGYHVVVREPEYRPRHAVMPSDGKMAIAMTPAGLRVAGQVELASVAAPPDWRRIEVLLDNLHRLFPAIPRRPAADRLDRWFGHRPSMPDSLPVIDRCARSPDVHYAFGHGHSGITMSPGTARLVARLASRLEPEIDPAPYRASRFR
ncbi:FAD-binding oxidoreductase [Aureimonas sp. ME7]|uniref:NAD(P)/FAD-dependent oxidoreductase n=1 Tax=Aureimonas sp. ME7 TaxID=2744252 RepID=UPI0015FD6049|nr:FAD-binding oxidoreductase [Aureimonas sp. ME7]